MSKKSFDSEWLQEMVAYNGECSIEDEIVGHGRWDVKHRAIFSGLDGKFYELLYSVPATESQGDDFWDEEIECREVVAVQKTITVYEPVK